MAAAIAAAAKADEKKPEPTLAETIVGGVIVLLLVGSCVYITKLYYNPRTKKWKLGDLRIHQPGLPALD